MIRTSTAPRRLVTVSSTVVALLVLVASSAPAQPVRYRIQPEASDVGFRATSRLMNAEGRFHRTAGEIMADPKDLSTATITLSIEAASIDTGIALRDVHLRSDDFLHVERFPSITFESVRVEAVGRRVIVFGRLTLHGVTREVAVPVDVDITNIALVASGEFVLRRTDYGISYRSFVNPVGNEVRVAFTFRARAA